MSILNISEPCAYDTSIESYQFHSYKPYVTSYNNNDEIRIPVNQQDLYILPSASSLYIEGTITAKNTATKEQITSVEFTNNPILFLFQDIRYEINGVEIDKVKNVGVTTTMKSLLSMSEHDAKCSKIWGWDINGTKCTKSNFSACIPLSRIMGFAEDYNKILINCKHELILLRSNSDLNSVKLNTSEVVDLSVSKIVWRLPHIKVSDRERINLLKYLEKDRAISIAFRNWDLYEYPLLPKTTKHTWAIKTSSQIEKPRYVIIGFQTNRKNIGTTDSSYFDHCHVRDVRVFLNSVYFPYESLNVNFDEENFSLLYDQYAKFQQSYYGRRCEPLLSVNEFKNKAPLFVVDCSRQSETLKTSAIDVRVEIESNKPFPDHTCAYCLILNDCVFEYKPLTSIVKKLT